jgi:hypothetical protein
VLGYAGSVISKRFHTNLLPLLLLLGVVVLVLAACGGDDDDDDGGNGDSEANGEDGEDGEGTPESIVGEPLSEAGFPTVYTADEEPPVLEEGQAGEDGRRVFLRQEVTAEDGTVVDYRLRPQERPTTDQTVECAGEEYDGPQTSDVDVSEPAGGATVAEGGAIDLSIRRSIGVFEEGDERVAICLQYEGVYSGTGTELEGIAGTWVLTYVDGETTLTFDEGEEGSDEGDDEAEEEATEEATEEESTAEATEEGG